MKLLRLAILFPLLSGVQAMEPVDHVSIIQGLGDADAKAGQQLYALHCAACHGIDGDLALNPLARRFAKDELKFGSDPYALWKTISYGNGLMFRWDALLTAKERYQIVQHLREDIIKPKNPTQYFEPDSAYFDKLNTVAAADAKAQEEGAQRVAVAPGMIDGSGGTRMIYGPFLQHAVSYGPIADINWEHIENTTERALIVDLPGEYVMCYDAARLSISGIWSGDRLADTEDTHHTSYKGKHPLMPSGELHYHNIDAIGWSGGDLKFNGHYLHGETVMLDYSVGRRSILEIPSAIPDSGTLVRHFRIGPGPPVRCLISQAITSTVVDLDSASLSKADDGATWLSVPASNDSIKLSVAFSFDGQADLPKTKPDYEAPTKGGPRRWPQTVQSALATGENIEGYAADELTAPLANPYGSWMRLTALDFFADGQIAVSTLSGDVWIVSWTEDNPSALTWSRYAAGLYEPLGLRIVDDVVYVRGRDRITRLHDLNGDGEADHYESFYEDPNEIGASYHAFVYDLQTDDSGYFYFSQSGYKSPLMGAVVRLSADGQHAEFIGTDLRNPNGMGAGGPNNWVTITDNPSGVGIYNGFTLIKEGAHYGYQHERTTPMLVVLPASADSSSGGQCWSDLERWGPLSGSIIHTSYSRSAAFYCFAQDLEPYPNGFAIRLPFDLKAGAMRPRVSPVDGQVYIACQRGWDSIARTDGVIYRIRHTGEPSHLIQNAVASKTGIRLTFACDLNPTSIDPMNFSVTREYDKPKKGVDIEHMPFKTVTLINPQTIEVGIPGIELETLDHRTKQDVGGQTTVRVNPAISLKVKFRAADGTPIEQTVHATINSLP